MQTWELPGAEPFGQGGAGQLPATGAFGGTSNLVSLDALQEFRIQTSTFAPEYGRTPGGQVSVVTKSGTNDFHGTAFEYFRNDVLDANDWFADHLGLQEARTAAERFRRRAGRANHEGQALLLRLLRGAEGAPASCCGYLRPDAGHGQNAPAVVQPLLNAFPKPNGPDLGNGTAQFASDYSDPSSLNAGSIRIDYLPTAKITIFGRYNYAPSSLDQRGGGTVQPTYSDVDDLEYSFQSFTLGSNQAITPRLTNEFRFNYSRSRASNFYMLDNFGGAVPPPESQLYPTFARPNSSFEFFGDFTPNGLKFVTGKLGKQPAAADQCD